MAEIAVAAQKLDLSVVIFSGYLLEELLDQQFKGASRLLAATDVLVDGEYIESQTENVRNWVGSTNQRFHYLTSRYSSEVENRSLMVTNEWRIFSDGTLLGNGLPFSMIFQGKDR